MTEVYIFLAEGFEEIEGLMVVDLLRRAGIEVTMVSLESDQLVTGSHGIQVRADGLFQEMDFSCGKMLVLPGGMPGTKNLLKHEELGRLLCKYEQQKKWVAAICAAPIVLGACHLLKGRRVTCYPDFIEQLEDAEYVEEPVVIDENIITSRGFGTAIAFSAVLITILRGAERAEKVKSAILYKE